MSKEVTPKHIENLMSTNRFVLRLYNNKKLLQTIEFEPKTFDEYLAVLNEANHE